MRRPTWTFPVAAIAMLALLVACGGPKLPAKVFTDVTDASGLGGYTGMTHGAYWGDFDGDGLPDLYVTNHLNSAKLYRNLGNGRFEDVTVQWLGLNEIGGDKHGAAWADYDNDGRLDLVQLTGAERGVGSEPKRLFHNLGNRFEEVGDELGVSNPYGRTRSPLWLDIDRDGKLDLLEGADQRFDERSPPLVFLQRNGRFEPSTDVASFASKSVPFCVLTALTDSAAPDLVCRTYGKTRALQTFSTAGVPMRELDLLPQTAFEDLAAADFDNDGAIDIYLARKNPAPPVGLGRPHDNEAIADVYTEARNVDKPLGFAFRSGGKIAFRIVPQFTAGALTADDLHIGASGKAAGALEFSLSPDDADVAGTSEFKPGDKPGVYIGLTPPDKWQVLVSASREAVTGPQRWQQIAIDVTSSELLSDVVPIGDTGAAEEAPARLFMNRGGKFVEESDKRGVNARKVSAVSVVAGDFDNDMHVDLFVVVSGEIGKQENLLLLNRGDGRFDVVAGAGGASGDRLGVGDTVTAADFDRDGLLDLLITSGGSMGRSMGLPSQRGGYRLYRNVLANGNHWLEIDLEGTKSNRDGIGARVELTAGGVTQVRIQDGGLHDHAQNHSRLHFGLAKNAQADRIVVRWPSGATQEVTNVRADQVLRLREP